jgi:methionyl-tRNA formyltransferase
VATGEGALAVERLQLEGRKAVTAAEFARGYSAFVGSQLGNTIHSS